MNRFMLFVIALCATVIIFTAWVFFAFPAYAQGIPTCAVAIKVTPMGPFPCSVTLTWQDNSTNEDGFIIQRRLNGGAWADLSATAVNVVSAIDATLQQSTTVDNKYDYQVIAQNTAGRSAPTNIASYIVPKAVSVPAPATSLTITFLNATGQIKLTGGRTINIKNQSGSMMLTGDISVVDIQ